MARSPLPSTSPIDQTCPKCGWSLLTSGRSQEAHEATCDGLKRRRPRVPPSEE